MGNAMHRQSSFLITEDGGVSFDTVEINTLSPGCCF